MKGHLTFLPPPNRDGVFRLNTYREQQLPGSTEVDVSDAFGMGAAEDGQRLLGHGIPYVDGRSEA